MTLLSGITNGLAEVWTHKLRSFLTLVCVMLGVASLVIIVGFVSGLFKSWRVWISESGGIERIGIVTDQVPDSQKHLAALSPGLTWEDAVMLGQLSRYARLVSPEIELEDRLLRNGTATSRDRIQGVTPAILPVNRYEIARGRMISDIDVHRAESVAVLGTKVAKDLFPEGQDPLGATIEINGHAFTVIGLLKHYQMEDAEDGAWDPLQEKNQIAFVPLTAAQRKLTGQNQLAYINVLIDDVSQIKHAADELQNLVLAAHRGVRDFRIQTQEEMIENFNTFQASFMMVGAGVAIVTLLVSGIGIMNLMLASINERLREIGIRKALGAWDRDIFVQFLVESVVLSLLGGLCGIALGAVIVTILQPLTRSFAPPELSAAAMVGGFVFSVGIGILSGIYPATRAARMDPIDALRYD